MGGWLGTLNDGSEGYACILGTPKHYWAFYGCRCIFKHFRWNLEVIICDT